MMEEENVDQHPDGEEESNQYARVKSVETDNLGFFRRVYFSFTRLDFYGLTFVEHGKKATFYCLKLCLLIGFLTGLFFGISNWSVVANISNELQRQVPTITIKEGDLSVDVETPYRMSILDKYELIVDPDAKLNRVRLDSDVLMVMVDGSIYVRNGEKSFESWSLTGYANSDQTNEFILDSNTIAGWTSFFQWMLLIVSCLGLMVGYLIQGFFRVGLISVGGFFALQSDSALFNWKRLLKLSCYAVTPVLIADGLLFSMGLTLPYQELFLLGGGTIFVYYIVKHLQKNLKGIAIDINNDDQQSPPESGDSDEDDHDYFS